MNVPNKVPQSIAKLTRESLATQSKIKQNALIQSKGYVQAVKIMGDTFEGMDIEKEQKDNIIEVLEDKIGLPDSKVIQVMHKLGTIKITSRRKGDRTMDKLSNSPNNLKNFKIKKTIELKVLIKNFALIMICLQKQLHNNYLFVYLFLYTTPFMVFKYCHIPIMINYGGMNFIILSLRSIECEI